MGPKKPDIEKKQVQILEAALFAFSENGYEKTRIEDVASRAGIAKGSVYQYFKSKEALFLALSEFVIQQLMEQIMVLCAQGYPALVDGTLDLFKAEQGLFHLMMELWAFGDHERMNATFTAMYGELRSEIGKVIQREQALGQLPQAPSAASMAVGVIATIDGFFVQNQFSGDVELQALAREFLMQNYKEVKE